MTPTVRPSASWKNREARPKYGAMNNELECLRSELDRVETKIMPFGTYQGVRITDVARLHPAYLLWMVTTVALQPPLRDEIIRALRHFTPRRWKRGDPPPGRAKEKPMEPPADLGKAHLRVARPTDDLAAVTRFYRDGLGFKVVGEFKDHEGFDGIMLGHAGCGTTWNSLANTGTRPGGHRPTTTCWSSTSRIGRSGSGPCGGWRPTASIRSSRSTRIGRSAGRHSAIPTATGSFSRTPRGRREWHSGSRQRGSTGDMELHFRDYLAVIEGLLVPDRPAFAGATRGSTSACFRGVGIG